MLAVPVPGTCGVPLCRYARVRRRRSLWCVTVVAAYAFACGLGRAPFLSARHSLCVCRSLHRRLRQCPCSCVGCRTCVCRVCASVSGCVLYVACLLCTCLWPAGRFWPPQGLRWCVCLLRPGGASSVPWPVLPPPVPLLPFPGSTPDSQLARILHVPCCGSRWVAGGPQSAQRNA